MCIRDSTVTSNVRFAVNILIVLVAAFGAYQVDGITAMPAWLKIISNLWFYYCIGSCLTFLVRDYQHRRRARQQR